MGIRIRFLDFKEVRGLNKYIGLMFNPFPKPLIFNFVTPTNQTIHSFFCRTFWAYWYDQDNNLIQSRLIKPFQSNIYCRKPYSKLIEIPIRCLN